MHLVVQFHQKLAPHHHKRAGEQQGTSRWSQTSNFGLLAPPKRALMLIRQLNAFTWSP